MGEFSVDSTIRELAESKESVKKLGRELGIRGREETLSPLFKSAGYAFNQKSKWYKENDGVISDTLTIRQALEELGLSDKLMEPNRKLIEPKNEKLIETNNKLIEPVVTPDRELIETNNGQELIETNSKLIETNVLNALGMTSQELSVLKQIINERMNGEREEDIYSAVAKLKGRSRKNKTYYISEELTAEVEQFCNDMGVKLSLFVETALIEALIKYKK